MLFREDDEDKSKEIELVNKDFESDPLSPIRRLERRIDRLEETRNPRVDNPNRTENSNSTREFLHDITSIIKLNQDSIDNLIQSTNALKSELAKLPSELEEVTKNINELLNYIKEGAQNSENLQISSDVLSPLTGKLDELIQTNKKMIENDENVSRLLESIERKFRPPLPPRPPILAPLQR